MAIPLKLIAGKIRRFLASDALEVDAIKARSSGELHLGEPGTTVRVLGDLAVDGAGGGGGGGGAPVASIFGRIGAVVAASGDYTFTHVAGCISDTQHAALPGGTLHQCATALDAGFMAGGDKAKLDAIEAGAEVNDVTSVFGRTGDVLPQPGDYAFPDINGNLLDVQHGSLPGGALHQSATSLVSGFMAPSDKAKLDGIEAGAEVNSVTSVFGRSGDVLAQPGDYTAGDVAAVPIAEKGAALGVATLDGSGKVPVAQLPAISVADAFAVGSESAMLALAADQGDLAIRSDLNKSFVLAAEPASTLANWLELLTPTDAVLSVAGRTGAVVISKADIADLGNVTNDAQLKRAAGDFASFPHKPVPSGSDVLLLEDAAASGEKRFATVAQVLSGAATASLWLPDAAPLAPHPLDYEGGADISGFNEWDHGALMTMAASAGHLRLTHTGDGTSKLSGAYKTVPASELAFYAKLSVITNVGLHTRIGIFFAEDATDATKRAEVLLGQIGGSPFNEWFQHALGSFQTFTVNRGGLHSRSLTVYCRGRLSGSDVAFDVSDDGVSWVQATSSPVALGYTPQHFGVCVNSEAAGNVPTALVRFVRVFEGPGSSGQLASSLGREVRVGV